ncbi:unnamed protein product [Linum trigynum]|uniref:Glycosyltransferase 61 catalytic domain-containing protein n=1 Tax=Linum trigynum TaxID=586398 RepID=A0AAV2EYP8_9ROSI
MKKNGAGGLPGRSSTSKRKQKILRTVAAVIATFLVVVAFCATLHRHEPNQPENMNTPTRKKNETLTSLPVETVVSTVDNEVGLQQFTKPPTCHFGGRSDYCDIEGDVRVDPGSATVYQVLHPNSDFIARSTAAAMTMIKPYPRNGDETAMGLVRQWTVKIVPADHKSLPVCHDQRVHDSPALIFSLGAYFGHYLHAFSDVLVSLFVTAGPFDRRLHLLVTDGHHLQVAKFATIWRALSTYRVVDIDTVQPGGKAHCFSRVMVGLKGRDEKELSINSSESRYTMKDFRQFLRSAYSLEKTVATQLRDRGERKKTSVPPPRILIISREKTRAFTNVVEIVRTARELGFEVETVARFDVDVTKSARMANRVDVLMGVHGTGLTNVVFLPENGILIQVVPFGVDWLSNRYFGEPSRDMNVRYLEYKITKEESSLGKVYAPDDAVFTNPTSFRWEEFSSIYLQNQNVTVDVTRFRPMLVRALELLHQ